MSKQMFEYMVIHGGKGSERKEQCGQTRGFPGGADGKESACNAGDLGSIPGSGKIPWRRELPDKTSQREVTFEQRPRDHLGHEF